MTLELAAKLRPAKDILEQYGVSSSQFRIIAKDPQFKAAFREARAFWESDNNIKERIRTKAGYLVEDSIMTLYKMIHDDDVHAQQRLDAFWKLAKVSKTSGEYEKDTSEGSGRQVLVNITLGSDSMQLATTVPDGQTIEHEADNAN